MIVRTFGRRNRGLSLNNDVSDSPPLSQETAPSKDIYTFPFSTQESQETAPSKDICSFPFSTQESQETAPSVLDFDFGDPGNGVVKRSKRRKQIQSKKEVEEDSSISIWPSSSLMEAQEFGEMMEHVDEVDFALDGLKKGQPVRIRRTSLLSLLSICSTAQQRRLLRTHGMAKKIIDAILSLNFDDTPSNLAAVAVFYALTADGQDERLLESLSCIRFLLRLLKPVIPIAKENKTGKIGFKLLALHKDVGISRNTTNVLDSSSDAIISKVEEVLVRCKEMKSRSGDDCGLRRPELSPKWITLLILEKACLSKVSLDDTTGIVRKIGCNLKEKLREHGGLYVVFEVALECHSVLEGLVEQRSSPLIEDRKEVQSLMLLLKCLKIMENAAFLSSDNQSHLLEMEGQLNSHGSRISFTKLVISVIKILSGLYLKNSSASSNTVRDCSSSKAMSDADTFALTADCKVDRHNVVSTNSSDKSSSFEWSFSGKSFNKSQKDPGPSVRCSGHSVSSFQSATASSNDGCLIKMTTHSCERCDGSQQLLEDSEDPFAFDDGDLVPSKWDLLSAEKKISRTKRNVKLRQRNREIQDKHHYRFTMSQQESSNGEICQTEFANEEYHQSTATSCSQSTEEEYSSLLSDCLLAAVKVLMNLTNDNPLGCQQIAASGALETLSTLIARHFPSFCSYLPRVSELKEASSDIPLTDPELDFLVAILGLLVNLVEKDEHNRSQLAAASVPLPISKGSTEGSCMAVIPLLCAIFLANLGKEDAYGEVLSWNNEAALLQEEKEAEKMILEAYAALLLAFLSTESKSTRNAIAACLPKRSLSILVPVLERFVAFHFTLNMISQETHKAVTEVIESCRIP